MSLYDKYILPHLLNCSCNTKPFIHQRKKVIPLATGNVLEVGIGSGLNLPYYQKDNIKEIWGLDPSEELLEMARKKAKVEDMDVQFLNAKAEVMELDDNYFDTVLMTYTMCTIPNLSQALSEIKRVMKTDGRLVFCEHGASPEQQVFKWQNRVNNVWSIIAGGCNINKNIPSIIESSGLIISQMETMYLPKTPKILGYNYWGSAVLDD
ncbi:MAG TPA: class I SAM-dependent methyltransferase [Gammaproteobacteria bacterium]|nr:class I SAM-dependent methyltransferase [Gammaproteobacteria bacterium]HIK77505.1 class I SAM-dependent methyltransferase [Gammaproteobacteria bacterium]